MINPWLEISHSDYENHMSDVGQAQVLNELTGFYLDKYKPLNFALLGCSTGNGLEHVRPETKNVYAIDINPEYLKIAKERFDAKIYNLETINVDIQKAVLPFANIDLVFAGLILEYVEPKHVLPKIINTLSKKGVLVIVIQQNKQTTFVTKTKYKSLEKLSSVSKEVNEAEIDKVVKPMNVKCVSRKEIELTESKSFIVLEYMLL